MHLQHLGYRAASHAVIEVSQGTLYPGIAPTGFLFGHPDDQSTNLVHYTGPTDTLVWIRPFGGNELSVPRQDRVRGHGGVGGVWFQSFEEDNRGVVSDAVTVHSNFRTLRAAPPPKKSLDCNGRFM